MKFIYGVFNNRQPAEQAMTRLRRMLSRDVDYEQEMVTAAIHQQDLRNEDIPRSGNFATRSALVAGLLVGFGVGLFLTLLMAGAFAGIGGPPTIIGSAPVDAVLVTLAAAVFGAILAGIGGTAGNRAKVRSLRSELDRGHVVLTLEAPSERSKDIVRMLGRHGALEAGTI